MLFDAAEDGIFEDAQNQAVKEAVTWQFAQAMKESDLQEPHGYSGEDESH